uniref:Uncharacterized protein n=1 Tax=Physcomitrium patens TaxID=3218 RepID=A0A2K1KFS7_PHYPA|nr:hypothetical protein PHYPA_009010 [Physcomitrium patens]
MILVNTWLKNPIICFQHELKRMPITKQTRFILGIEDVKVFERKCKSKLICIEQTKIWQSDMNLIKGGYAIVITFHIA